jgi:hypothetical protein
MRPLTHFFLAYIAAVLATDDVRHRRLVCILGVVPDLDGVPVLFDTSLYLAYHHVALHSLPAGIAISAALAHLFSRYHNRWRWAEGASRFSMKSAFRFAFLGFAVHVLGDIVGTNWPVYLLHPFSELGVSASPLLSDHIIYDVINPAADAASALALFIIVARERRTPAELVYGGLGLRTELLLIGYAVAMFFLFPFVFRAMGMPAPT